MKSPRCGSQSGLTLMELMAAVAIFLGLAGMILQVLGGGLSLWSTGERTRESSEKAAVLLDRLEMELRHALATDGGDGIPRIRFYSDFVEQDSDKDGIADFRAQRLLFVRRLFEERSNTLLREAGTKNGDGVYYTGHLPDDPEAFFLATESMCEVCFLPLPDYRKGFEGRMVLWRAIRSPIGGSESLCESIDEKDGGLGSAPMDPIAENILHVGFEFLDSSVDDLSVDPGIGGPMRTWDSTRGILPKGDDDRSFRYAKGKPSLSLPEDDVFPTAVRITLIVAPPPEEIQSAKLRQELSAASRSASVELANGRFLSKLEARGNLHLRIGNEWVEAGPCDGKVLNVVRRGLFGTEVRMHPEGAMVLVGRTVRRTVFLPAAREDLARLVATGSSTP